MDTTWKIYNKEIWFIYLVDIYSSAMTKTSADIFFYLNFFTYRNITSIHYHLIRFYPRNSSTVLDFYQILVSLSFVWLSELVVCLTPVFWNLTLFLIMLDDIRRALQPLVLISLYPIPILLDSEFVVCILLPSVAQSPTFVKNVSSSIGPFFHLLWDSSNNEACLKSLSSADLSWRFSIERYCECAISKLPLRLCFGEVASYREISNYILKNFYKSFTSFFIFCLTSRQICISSKNCNEDPLLTES